MEVLLLQFAEHRLPNPALEKGDKAYIERLTGKVRCAPSSGCMMLRQDDSSLPGQLSFAKLLCQSIVGTITSRKPCPVVGKRIALLSYVKNRTWPTDCNAVYNGKSEPEIA